MERSRTLRAGIGCIPNLIMQWKRQAIEKLAKVFDDKAPEIQAGRDAEMTKSCTPRSARRGTGSAGGSTITIGEDPISALGDRTPDEAYGIEIDLENLAA